MVRDPRVYLWDVQQAAESIRQFMHGLDTAGYIANPLVRSAVERQFEIIGEGLNQLAKTDSELARRVPHLPEIVSFRNVLIHGYRRIDHTRIWDMAKNRLPALQQAVSALLSELGPPDP